jgi:hypothetical protein
MTVQETCPKQQGRRGTLRPYPEAPKMHKGLDHDDAQNIEGRELRKPTPCRQKKTGNSS